MCSTERKRSPRKPLIAVTMGDPAGIGPEIVVKAAAAGDLAADIIVVGDVARLQEAASICGLSLAIAEVNASSDARSVGRALPCFDVTGGKAMMPFGAGTAASGACAYAYVARASELALQREVDAICTAPLSKEALHAAGYIYPGHTELLAHLAGAGEVSMMLTASGLRVVHVTTHVGLLDAIGLIEPGLIERTIRRAHHLLKNAGLPRIRVGVCGINPHAGENGLFGRGEEDEKIAPAIELLKRDGIDVHGPLPADTLFFRAKRGDFDLVVAMYHDQGHGPVKVLGLEAGVNVTVGLPYLRSSVDHGTAFDIAGTSLADERSLIEAVRVAADLAPSVRTPCGGMEFE